MREGPPLLFFCHMPKQWGLRYPIQKVGGTPYPPSDTPMLHRRRRTGIQYAAVYLRMQKWKNYWNRSTFAKVIV